MFMETIDHDNIESHAPYRSRHIDKRFYWITNDLKRQMFKRDN